ncbi:glutaredoxin family protein [Deinococcus arenicola]|uniref:Glutaredoxin family protein n=1 Tax=Deinococcus arenicola TaxID=2994950 RepID=A0ABU4DRM3_9DEIO|nr:glutaredoxin family protein [Deinococcus sp. ZS9-10]MDV6375081.1 glutaredoxin family protein [Deinococcus sp. ZS9-10]
MTALPPGLPLLGLYTRAGCHLCEQAQQHLVRLNFRVELLDVDSCPEWQRQHGDDVPVLVLRGERVGERVLARGVLSPARLGLIKLQLLRELPGPSPQATVDLDPD